MHIYYLICPNSVGLNYNPGVSFISYGCRYLIKQADPEALFIPVSNIIHSQASWDILLEQADCLVLPGGSLFDPSDISVYWNDQVWAHISQAINKGILFADLWGYASYPFPPQSVLKSAADILAQPRTLRVLEVQKKAACVIPRDILAENIISTILPDVKALPCASFWSPDFFHIKSSLRLYNAVSVYPISRDRWFAESLYNISQVLSKEKPTFLICHTNLEYQWLRSFFPNATNIKCLFDPISLLDFYRKCYKVVSTRLHATIPAYALGCKVIYISFDSRSLALDQFGIPSVPYTSLKNGALPFRYTSLPDINPPDPGPFIDLFIEKIVSRF